MKTEKTAYNGRKKDENSFVPVCESGLFLLNAAKLCEKNAVYRIFSCTKIVCGNVNSSSEDIANDLLHCVNKPFEVIVTNPPFSIKWDGVDNPQFISDSRFLPAGVLAPKSKADFAFIMHILSLLANRGSATIVCFPGVLYRGGAERKIRKYLIDNNFVDCIIQLPDNLFIGTAIATCIMVLKKKRVDNNILFVDASRDYVKDTNNNKLTDENVLKIATAYMGRTAIKYYCHLVTNNEIVENDYNLAVSTYVETEDKSAVVDIAELNSKLTVFLERENVLRAEIDRFIAEIGVN